MIATPAPVDIDAAWRAALDLWGVTMRPPRVLRDDPSTSDALAWFAFPPSITVDLTRAVADGAGDHLVSVFAHEIGHHVLSPSTRIASLKIVHQMGRNITATAWTPLPVRAAAQLLANLWSDVLINDRVVALQRRRRPGAQPEMIASWQNLSRVSSDPPPLWWVIYRCYEIRWSLPAGTLCRPEPPAPTETPEVEPHNDPEPSLTELSAQLARMAATHPAVDAVLLADLVRTYAQDPVGGALPASMLLAPYVMSLPTESGPSTPGGCAGDTNETPATATELDEILGDPRMSGPIGAPRPSGGDVELPGGGQGYGLADTLALYESSDPDAVCSAWYQSQARPHVRPLRRRRPTAETPETIPGPTDLWEIDDEISAIDWPSTLSGGVTVIPGVTTRTRTELPDEPTNTEQCVELDLYLDSSGSMRRPHDDSPAVLAATITALSVLAAGGRVRVTSFSGPRQVAGTADFTRNHAEIMAALLTFFGGGTAFPLDLLAERFRRPAPNTTATTSPQTHLLVLSDDGLESMFGAGQPEHAHVAATIRPRLASANLVLVTARSTVDEIARAAGYDVVHAGTVDGTPAVCAALAQRISESRYDRR